jgi:hypothetical protein
MNRMADDLRRKLPLYHVSALSLHEVDLI